MSAQKFRATYDVDGRLIDLSAGYVIYKGKKVHMPHQCVEILRRMLARPEEVCLRAELLDDVWGGNHLVGERSLNTSIYRIRTALGDRSVRRLIETIPRRGYRFADGVKIRPIEVSALESGQVVRGRPHWVLDRELACDHSGSMWIARHCRTDEPRIFKLSTDEWSAQALKRDILILRHLQNHSYVEPASMRILDWDMRARPYFIEFACGIGATLVAHEERMSDQLSVRVRLGLKIAQSLSQIHRLGIAHGDLNPKNIYLNGDFGQENVSILNFGSASIAENDELVDLVPPLPPKPPVTAYGLIYWPPERIGSDQTGAGADTYALGVMMYQLACRDFQRVLAPGWETDLQSKPLINAIAGATHRDPLQRVSADTFANELADCLETHNESLRGDVGESVSPIVGAGFISRGVRVFAATLLVGTAVWFGLVPRVVEPPPLTVLEKSDASGEPGLYARYLHGYEVDQIGSAVVLLVPDGARVDEILGNLETVDPEFSWAAKPPSGEGREIPTIGCVPGAIAGCAALDVFGGRGAEHPKD